MKRYAECLLLAITILALQTRSVYAYLDPGTGSILVQGLIAAVAGGLFTVKMYWGRIKQFITGKRNSADKDSEQQ